MEQDRSRKASSSSVGQEVAHIVWNYPVQNSEETLPIMHYMNAECSPIPPIVFL